MLDHAIIGAGVAGLYCAFRLSHCFPEHCIGVFECTARIGGRLRSEQFAEGGQIIELGAQSFSDHHENLCGLVSELSLAKQAFDFERSRYFLRGRWLDARGEAQWANAPYNMRAAEKGLDPVALLRRALEHIEGARSGEPGHKLHDGGLWNALSEVLSFEAQALLADALGSTSAFQTGQVEAGLATLQSETRAQKHFSLIAGFEALPRALAKSFSQRTPIALEHALIRIAKTPDGLELDFRTPRGARRVQVRHLILALPARALAVLQFDDAQLSAAFARDLEAIAPIGACKLFAVYKRPWWLEAPHDITAFATDLPLRQCYSYRAQDREQGAVLMAAFADEPAAGFWRALARGAGYCDVRGLEAAHHPLAIAAQAQLREMFSDHFGGSPLALKYVDWSQTPSGAAWHAWEAGSAPHVVRARMRRRAEADAIFVCGEAIAELQGWVEGAINNAEMMLERHFGVPRPTWVRGDYPFEA